MSVPNVYSPIIARLVIPANQQVTEALTPAQLAPWRGLGIIAPEVMTGVAVVQVPDAEIPSYWVEGQSPPGTDVEIPAGKCVWLTPGSTMPMLGLRIASDAIEAAPRVFVVVGAR